MYSTKKLIKKKILLRLDKTSVFNASQLKTICLFKSWALQMHLNCRNEMLMENYKMFQMLANFNLRSLKNGRYVKLRSLENWVFTVQFLVFELG